MAKNLTLIWKYYDALVPALPVPGNRMLRVKLLSLTLLTRIKASFAQVTKSWEAMRYNLFGLTAIRRDFIPGNIFVL
jgi:hypothetical protein